MKAFIGSKQFVEFNENVMKYQTLLSQMSNPFNEVQIEGKENKPNTPEEIKGLEKQCTKYEEIEKEYISLIDKSSELLNNLAQLTIMYKNKHDELIAHVGKYEQKKNKVLDNLIKSTMQYCYDKIPTLLDKENSKELVKQIEEKKDRVITQYEKKKTNTEMNTIEILPKTIKSSELASFLSVLKSSEIEMIKHWTNTKVLKKIFDTSIDGWNSKAFSNACLNNTNLMFLFMTNDSEVFGAFSQTVLKVGNYNEDESHFIFSLRNASQISKPNRWKRSNKSPTYLKSICLSSSPTTLVKIGLYEGKEVIGIQSLQNNNGSYISSSIGNAYSGLQQGSLVKNKVFNTKRVIVIKLI